MRTATASRLCRPGNGAVGLSRPSRGPADVCTGRRHEGQYSSEVQQRAHCSARSASSKRVRASVNKATNGYYAEWLRALRGMMKWAGFQGTFGGAVSTVAVSADDEEWHTFVVELNKEFGTDLFTVKDIVEQLGHGPYTMNGSHLDSAALPERLASEMGLRCQGRRGRRLP